MAPLRFNLKQRGVSRITLIDKDGHHLCFDFTHRFGCLVLGGLVFDDILSLGSDSSSDDEYPLTGAGGMPDSARWSLRVPIQEPTSLTTSS